VVTRLASVFQYQEWSDVGVRLDPAYYTFYDDRFYYCDKYGGNADAGFLQRVSKYFRNDYICDFDKNLFSNERQEQEARKVTVSELAQLGKKRYVDYVGKFYWDAKFYVLEQVEELLFSGEKKMPNEEMWYDHKEKIEEYYDKITTDEKFPIDLVIIPRTQADRILANLSLEIFGERIHLSNVRYGVPSFYYGDARTENYKYTLSLEVGTRKLVSTYGCCVEIKATRSGDEHQDNDYILITWVDYDDLENNVVEYHNRFEKIRRWVETAPEENVISFLKENDCKTVSNCPAF
jgi:hypothetical protein